MFVRNNNNTPVEISKIFVRDSLGNPQEICKVYVRDSSGNPVLVYECQPIVVICPQCAESNIVPFYYSINESLLRPRFSFALNYPVDPTQPCNLGTVPPFLGQESTIIPETSIEVDKNYWSNVGQYSTYTLGAQEQTLSSSANPFLSLRKFSLPSTCEFCQNVDVPTQAWFTDAQYYWKKLKEGYDEVTNYPLLPGHIVVDWNTLTVRDTVLVIMKPLQRIFNKICTHPNSIPGNFSGIPYCFHIDGTDGEPPVDVQKYPFYNRSILLRYEQGDTFDVTTSYCGQELCSSGLWGTLDWSSANSCYNGYHSSSSIFVNLPGLGGATLGNCSGGPISWNGTIELNPEWCGCCGYCNRNPDEPGCEGAGTGCCDDPCTCFGFYSQTYTDPSENPFSFVLNIQDHGTDRMLPTPQSNGALQDCCTSTCYGPVNMTNTKKSCRQVYQIPPINTGVPGMANATDPYSDNLGFFKDMTVAVLMDSTASQQPDSPSGSTAYVRMVLPYYVQLHSSLRSHMVSLKETQYTNFINDGIGPTSNAAAYSVWQALSNMFGIKLGTTFFNVPVDQRIWLSSNTFTYNEYTDFTFWNDVPAPFIRIAGTDTQQQKPGIWWNMKGYPTEKTTHYVVLELTYTGNTCISSLFDENQLKDLENQKQIALGIKFYPVERTCPNNKHYKHPIYQTYIVPENYQKFASSTDAAGQFLGYVDGWDEAAAAWFEANNNVDGGGFLPQSELLNTVVEENFWIYQDTSGGTPVSKSRCLVYPRAKTYQQFLSKYYRVPTT
jgi:hypothetical protein